VSEFPWINAKQLTDYINSELSTYNTNVEIIKNYKDFIILFFIAYGKVQKWKLTDKSFIALSKKEVDIELRKIKNFINMEKKEVNLSEFL
jgi:hypothetical protein